MKEFLTREVREAILHEFLQNDEASDAIIDKSMDMTGVFCLMMGRIMKLEERGQMVVQEIDADAVQRILSGEDNMIPRVTRILPDVPAPDGFVSRENADRTIQHWVDQCEILRTRLALMVEEREQSISLQAHNAIVREINLQLDQARGELFACQRRLNESGIRDGG